MLIFGSDSGHPLLLCRSIGLNRSFGRMYSSIGRLGQVPVWGVRVQREVVVMMVMALEVHSSQCEEEETAWEAQAQCGVVVVVSAVIVVVVVAAAAAEETWVLFQIDERSKLI